EQADRDGLAVLLLRDEQAHRLGRADGSVDADRGPLRRLLPARAAANRVRPDAGSGAGVSLGAGLVLPSFPGSEPPDWIRRFLADGGRGIVLFAYNVDDLPALAASLRAEREDVLLALDEEGGVVTRLEWREGSYYPSAAGPRAPLQAAL